MKKLQLSKVFFFLFSFHSLHFIFIIQQQQQQQQRKKLEKHSEELKTHQRRFEIERNAVKTVNESKTKEFVRERAPKLHERVRILTEMKVNTKKPCNTLIELRGDITQIDKMIQELGMIVSGVLFSFSLSLFLCVFQ